jgi:hypothetical protein
MYPVWSQIPRMKGVPVQLLYSTDASYLGCLGLTSKIPQRTVAAGSVGFADLLDHAAVMNIVGRVGSTLWE